MRIQKLGCRCFQSGSLLTQSIEMGFRYKLFWSDSTVVDGSIILGDIISIVVWVRTPKEAELFLCGAVTKSVKSHIHRLEVFAGNVIGNDSKCSPVICLYQRWW